MKISQLSIILFASLYFSACEEKEIPIPELSVGARKVVAEELTGVRCPNCPDGTAELLGLTEIYGENLITISIHAADGYDQPEPESQYDFRITNGRAYADYIGAAEFFPTAAINRRLLSGASTPYIARNQWAGIIAQEIAKEPEIGLFLENTYDAATRKLDMHVNLVPEKNLSGEHRITLLITQDSIVDYQKVGLTPVLNYVHRHALRGFVSGHTGDLISEPMTAGNTISKTYSMNLPANWDAHHCSVIAFIARGGNPDKEILQADEKHVE